MRVQPVRGRPDERHRRRERRRRGDRERRAADDRALSTDKAVNPVNLYGATKLCAEKIVTQGNAYAGDSAARFASVRYGNVVGSRGSVVPLFKAQARDRRAHDHRRAHDALLDHARAGRRLRARLRSGGWTAARSSCRRSRACASSTSPRRSRPTPSSRSIGIRPGEKLHEVLLTEDESRHALEVDERLRHPARATRRGRCASVEGGTPLPDGFQLLERHERPSGSTSTSCGRWRRTSSGRRVTADVPPVRPPGDRRRGRRRGRRGAARRADHAGPARRALRGGARRVPRRARTSSRSRTAPPRCTAPRSPPGSGRATRCSRRRSASPPPRTARSTRARGRASSTSRRRRGTSTRRPRPRRSATRTRAVIAVELRRPAGRPRAARSRVRDRVVVIEDACHALGGARDGGTRRRCRRRRHDDLLAPPGEGDHDRRGRAVTTEDDELAARLRLFRTHGITKEGVHPSATEGGWYYEMQALGFNYRITDFQCALGLSQLRAARRVRRARATRSPTRYRELLADETRIALPPAAPAGDRSTATTCSSSASRRAPRRGWPCSTRCARRASACRCTTSRSTAMPYYRDVARLPAGRRARPPRSTTRARSRCRCSRR